MMVMSENLNAKI